MRPATRLRPQVRSNSRVLFLSCHLPWPAISGGRRRELELIRRLSERFDIHLVVVSKTVEEDLANVGVLRRFCREVEVFSATRPRALAAEVATWTRATVVAAVTPEDRELIAAGLCADRGSPVEPEDVLLLPDGADHVSNLRPVSPRQRLLRPAAPLVTLLANFAYS